MKERILGALFVVIYAALMLILPYNYYYSLVYFLGVVMVLELFLMARLSEVSPFGVAIFSLFFFLAVSVPLIVNAAAFFLSNFSLVFYSATFFSYVLILFPVVSSLFIFTVVLLVKGEVEASFFPLTFFFNYIFFGTLSLAKLTKPYFILLLSIVWTTDTFAYLVGRFLGRRKLVPSVSPKKTVEGSLGGSFLGALVSTFVAGKLSLFSANFETFLLMLLLTFVSQLGDLIESSLKRFFKVKDSGSTIPGHGGVLDRLDSTLAVAPFLLVLGGLS
ncbi:phosphatidate cytidylyltransferase [Thermovibrio sp.]